VLFVLNDGCGILLFLILTSFRTIHIARLKRDFIPSRVIKIVGYLNYLVAVFKCFRCLLSHLIRRDSVLLVRKFKFMAMFLNHLLALKAVESEELKEYCIYRFALK
jgi:hypothetical protein